MKLEQQQQQNWVFSTAFVFFFAAFLLFGSIASLYSWVVFTPFVRTPYVGPTRGCQDDNEGSWSIGVFYGSSPFSLSPIEDVSAFTLLNFGHGKPFLMTLHVSRPQIITGIRLCCCFKNLWWFFFGLDVFREMCGRMRVQLGQWRIQWSLVHQLLKLDILVTLLPILFFIFK